MLLVALIGDLFNQASKLQSLLGDTIKTIKINNALTDRESLAKKAIQYLNEFGGPFIQVDFFQGSYQGVNDTELQVSITYRIENPHFSPKSEHATPAEYCSELDRAHINLHTAYSVDFFKPETLHRDLKILSDKFFDIYSKVYGTDYEEAEAFTMEFAQILSRLKKQEAIPKQKTQDRNFK